VRGRPPPGSPPRPPPSRQSRNSSPYPVWTGQGLASSKRPLGEDSERSVPPLRLHFSTSATGDATDALAISLKIWLNPPYFNTSRSAHLFVFAARMSSFRSLGRTRPLLGGRSGVRAGARRAG
jgi:hypothetical protein